MRANPFESQLERLARTLTEQFGVQVVCQGDNAWTDGKQIVLPSLPDPMEEGTERMMVGYLDHEMAHVAFSDFGVAGEFDRKHPGCLGLLNVVEDALIERRAMERWPGVRANLDAMFRQIRSRVAQLIQQRGPFERFCTAVYLGLSHHSDLMGLDRELAGYDDLLARFPQVQNTHQAAELAELILHRWQQRATQRPQTRPRAGHQLKPDHDGDGQRSSAADDDPHTIPDETSPPEAHDNESSLGQETEAGSPEHAESPGKGPAPGDSANSGSPTPQPQATEAEDASPASESPAPASIAGNGAGGHGGSLIGEALLDAIQEAVRCADGSRQYRVYTKAHDRIETLLSAADSDVRALTEVGRDTVRRLRRGLTNALRSAEKRWWRDDQTRGELSPRTLYRLVTDRTRLDIFRVRSVIQGRSTAVNIVLDASGSMSTRKMEVARQALRVLLESLSDLRIPTEAIMFTTGNAINTTEVCQATGQDANQLRERYGRISNLEIGVIKRFEESVKLAMQRLPGIRGTGLTPLGEAMQIGAARLLVRPETRRILLVLTDGKAGCEGSGEAATLHAQHVAGLIRRAGIEVIGVGIQDDSVCTIVENSIVIQKLEDLPAQLCKLLGRTLQKGLCHVG